MLTTRSYWIFIIGSQGQFLNEVDPQGQSRAGIVNGASFNYASCNDERHRQLDVDPTVKWDPAFRKDILKVVDQSPDIRYRSPSQKQYRRKSSSFAEAEVSLYQAVKREVAHMKRLIKEYKKTSLTACFLTCYATTRCFFAIFFDESFFLFFRFDDCFLNSISSSSKCCKCADDTCK
ncbi:DUF3114 domain-containing protein [Streptococcus sp. X16XC17]|nr:DUF3114 domain-containing protein [Streptococcus sp. X16XC17]